MDIDVTYRINVIVFLVELVVINYRVYSASIDRKNGLWL